MTDSDRVRFAQIMAYLSLNFPGRDVDGRLVSVYFSDLSSYDVGAVEAAARKHVKSSRHFPFISELVALIEA
jgi:hypothetical protein